MFRRRTVNKELESAATQTMTSTQYGYHASIEVEVGRGSPDDTVTITHHVESTRRPEPSNESEDWLVQTHGKYFQ